MRNGQKNCQFTVKSLEVWKEQSFMQSTCGWPGTKKGSHESRGLGLVTELKIQKPRAPGHEFGIKTTFPLTNTLAVRRFLSNFLDVSLFKESKKRSEEKGK